MEFFSYPIFLILDFLIQEICLLSSQWKNVLLNSTLYLFCIRILGLIFAIILLSILIILLPELKREYLCNWAIMMLLEHDYNNRNTCVFVIPRFILQIT